MSTGLFFASLGVGLVCMGLYGLIVRRHLIRKIIAVNVMGSGTFTLLVALGRDATAVLDPVPHAMVITGIVVALSATALALSLMLKMARATGSAELPDGSDE